VETVDRLGTSMGGIIGMILASLPGSPLRKLVLNDVGSVVPKPALERICKYLGSEPAFESLEALEGAMRAVSPFGELANEHWRHLAVHSSKQDDKGRWCFRYDPAIGDAFRNQPISEVDLRMYWNAVRGPALVIRGAESDLLTEEIAAEMRNRPHTEVLVVPKTGHPPMLMKDAEIMAVRRFLLG
jgi:pimeloyl-ACP methyl ester carboxylesterase